MISGRLSLTSVSALNVSRLCVPSWDGISTWIHFSSLNLCVGSVTIIIFSFLNRCSSVCL